MSTSSNVASASASDRLATRLFVAALIMAGLVAPFAGAAASLALGGYVYFVGPPLDLDAPRNGQVVVHIDVLGKQPPDIARIRVTDIATGATVWDVKPTTPTSECWNRCWNLTLSAGSNPASFAAGRQQFTASVPRDPSFSLTRGTAYFFEVWDSKGRLERSRFSL